MENITTLEDLAAWAASNHIQSIMPHDWLPLLNKAFEMGYKNGCKDTRDTIGQVIDGVFNVEHKEAA